MAINPFEAPVSPARGARSRMGLGAVLFSFEGRIPRSIYWGYTVFTTAAYVLAGAGAAAAESALGEGVADPLVIPVIGLMYVLYIWTALAVQVKRWHDRGRSGFMVFVNLIPCFGPLYSLVELGFLPGDVGTNDYGAAPT